MSTTWTSRYAQRTKGMRSSTIRELLKFTQRPEVISFAGGLPASDVFPTERFREACCKVIAEKPHLALQYGATEGYEPLREMIARHIARYGIKAKSENVLITSGSQQALDLIGKLLINPGDRVLGFQPDNQRESSSPRHPAPADSLGPCCGVRQLGDVFPLSIDSGADAAR